MDIATLLKNGATDGRTLLILDKKEGQTLLRILAKYVEQNKRDRTAKRWLERLETDLECY